MVGIHVKNYEHTNRALGNWDTPRGKYISSKKQYFNELAKQGMMPYEEATKITDLKEEAAKNKPLLPSQDTKDILRYAQTHADSEGNVKLSGKIVDLMVEKKIVQDQDIFYKKLPKCYQDIQVGGFESESKED